MALRNKKLLLDAVFINNSGGLVLLKYLIDELEKTNYDIVYLLDYRIKGICLGIKNSNNVFYLKNSLLNRFIFYMKNKHSFSKVFCFGNIPPSIRLDAIVYTYFHQLNYLQKRTYLGFINNIVFRFKKFFFRLHINLTDFWIVQTEYVKNELASKYTIKHSEKIYIIPFYPPIIVEDKLAKVEESFLYVSSGFIYKNHFNLISAFCKFFDRYGKGILYLTISDEFVDLRNLIDKYVLNGYPIVNLGNLNRDELGKYYSSCKFLIFPSIVESLGLGILEGIENDCVIIGPDLPWIFPVCVPSILFNPFSVDSIFDAFIVSQTSNYDKSKQMTFNKIDEIVNLLMN